jgi:hypothetical protein
MCGSLVARTLKTHKGHSRSILVQAYEPYVQKYGVLRVRNAQSGVYNREFGRGLRGAILGFLAIESG